MMNTPLTRSKWLATAAVALLASAGSAQAALTTFSQSALLPTSQLYTDLIGGGIGNVAVMTGGGNSPGVGNPSGRNDDGFALVNLDYSFSFFGASYTSFYANNNGNISFTRGNSAYIPSGPIGADIPTISAWFGDVDTRATSSDVLHIRQDANQTILTWLNVGYYNSNGDRLNTFQMVIRGDDYAIPDGEGAIGFYWLAMPWESTDTSTTAAVGFGDGTGNAVVLEGSNQPGLNQAVAYKKTWFTTDLTPVDPNPVPEPGTLALLGLGLAGLLAGRRKLS